jgi:hypothetical protein
MSGSPLCPVYAWLVLELGVGFDLPFNKISAQNRITLKVFQNITFLVASVAHWCYPQRCSALINGAILYGMKPLPMTLHYVKFIELRL